LNCYNRSGNDILEILLFINPLNITFPNELINALNKVSGLGKRSKFKTEAVRQRIEQKEKLQKILMGHHIFPR